MRPEQRIRDAEAQLFNSLGVRVEESFLSLRGKGLRLRRIEHGTGQPILLLHGVSLGAISWAPLFTALPDYRLIAVDLPGHGLSDPYAYVKGQVRAQTCGLIPDVLSALGLPEAPVVANSFGAMLALWHAAGDAPRISSLVAVGDPGVALPGARVTMPLSLLTLPGVGVGVLRAPSPRAVYRRLLARGLGATEASASPGELIDALRLTARRPENARTMASLVRAINRFRWPRPESVLGSAELGGVRIPTLFVWGADDPYLAPEDARPSIARIPSATLQIVPGGHAPWLIDPAGIASRIRGHLRGPASC